MDQLVLSDEERRLLREYRITKVPLRRKQLHESQSSSQFHPSAAWSNAAEQQQTPGKTGGQKQTHSKTPNKGLHTPIRKSKSHHHHHHHGQRHRQNGHHHHHHHRHHHHHHHRHKHKSATPTHELTAEELNKMLDLASGLSYLKLVPPMGSANGTQNTKLSLVKTRSKH